LHRSFVPLLLLTYILIQHIVVVRTPEKLLHILDTNHHVPTATIKQYLTIHAGDAKTPSDVSKALVSQGCLVDTIYSSIGAYPDFAFSLSLERSPDLGVWYGSYLLLVYYESTTYQNDKDRRETALQLPQLRISGAACPGRGSQHAYFLSCL
jgi:hypothetical protein